MTQGHTMPMPATSARLLPRKNQRGATLIELMVGITIGLLTVTVALGALMVSRGISGTVSEASQLQQQASYAFRVIGQQLRQAGGRQLDIDNATATATSETPLQTRVSGSTESAISGKDEPGKDEYALIVNFQNVSELVTNKDPSKDPELKRQIHDCLGEDPKDPTANPSVTSQFKRDADNNSLFCKGTANDSPQALIENVQDFTVRYLVQTSEASTTALPSYQYVDAATATTNWQNVYAVQVCLELEGTENINTLGVEYTKCDGTQATRGNRLRMVFRNIYHIRNHAWGK